MKDALQRGDVEIHCWMSDILPAIKIKVRMKCRSLVFEEQRMQSFTLVIGRDYVKNEAGITNFE